MDLLAAGVGEDMNIVEIKGFTNVNEVLNMIRESELSLDQAIGIIESEINEMDMINKGIINENNVKYKALQIALSSLKKQDGAALLNLKEFCDYTGLGMTKAREILKRQNSTFTVRIGNRLYANKKLFDEHLAKCTKYQIPI